MKILASVKHVFLRGLQNVGFANTDIATKITILLHKVRS